jgi:hypothetical protein
LLDRFEGGRSDSGSSLGSGSSGSGFGSGSGGGGGGGGACSFSSGISLGAGKLSRFDLRKILEKKFDIIFTPFLGKYYHN